MISKNENSDQIIELLEKSYLPNYNLAEATRHIINNLFGDYGLLILDGNDVRLKSKLVDVIDKDINNNIFYDIIKKLIVIYQKIIIFKHMFVKSIFLKFLIKKEKG